MVCSVWFWIFCFWYSNLNEINFISVYVFVENMSMKNTYICVYVNESIFLHTHTGYVRVCVCDLILKLSQQASVNCILRIVNLCAKRFWMWGKNDNNFLIIHTGRRAMASFCAAEEKIHNILENFFVCLQQLA